MQPDNIVEFRGNTTIGDNSIDSFTKEPVHRISTIVEAILKGDLSDPSLADLAVDVEHHHHYYITVNRISVRDYMEDSYTRHKIEGATSMVEEISDDDLLASAQSQIRTLNEEISSLRDYVRSTLKRIEENEKKSRKGAS